MKDSKKFLILTILGSLCYLGYIILVCFRGPCLTDFITISINMFIWLSVSIIQDYLKLRRAEKEEYIKKIIEEFDQEE